MIKRLFGVLLLLATFAGAEITRTTVNLGTVNGTTLQQMTNGLDSTGGGMLAFGLNCQFDDVSPSAVTENNFAPGRCDSLRRQYVVSWAQVGGSDNIPNNIAYPFIAGGALNGRSIGVTSWVYNGTQLDEARGANALQAGLQAGVQAVHLTLADNNNGTFTSAVAQGEYRFRVVSAANTAQTIVLDLANVHDTLSIHAACSAGTAALTVEASADNANWIQADSITAAQFNVKVYGATTAGAAVAAASAGPIAPLSYRYVRVTEAACGASNTSTLTMGAK